MQITKADQVRGRKEKKPKKLSKSQLNKKADKEWSIAVKERAGWKCEVCGHTENLNSHHIFSRKNYSVRWDLDNGICLCPSHHMFSHTMSAHKAPLSFVALLKSNRSEEWYDKLMLKAMGIKK